MRVERIARDKVRIFISYDDLEERGIDRNEIWQNGRKVQELFWDMMETAYVEVGFEIAGPIAVEAFTMPTEGVVVIVTRVPSIPGHRDDASYEEDGDEEDNEFAQDDNPILIFQMNELEDVIHSAHTLLDYHLDSSLYQYEGMYHLSIDDPLVMETYQSISSILMEYGDLSFTTKAMLNEYGKCIFADNAISNIVEKFHL